MTKKINGFKNDFKLCPMCGSQKIENHENRKWICPDCGFDLYNNVATAVGVIIYDKNQKEGLFSAWQKMQNENPIIENDLANDYEEIKAIQEDMESDN